MLNNSLQNRFKAGQIVCLESGNRYLYSEVIQIVSHRQLCWARPLTVAIVATEAINQNFPPDRESIDLRSSADLLLPLPLFRAAYDTEVIELLAELTDKQHTEKHFDLNGFIKQVCQENPQQFQSTST